MNLHHVRIHWIHNPFLDFAKETKIPFLDSESGLGFFPKKCTLNKKIIIFYFFFIDSQKFNINRTIEEYVMGQLQQHVGKILCLFYKVLKINGKNVSLAFLIMLAYDCKFKTPTFVTYLDHEQVYVASCRAGAIISISLLLLLFFSREGT